MLALSEIIDFLLNLMRDETARAEFEQDPQGTLARAGLEGITGQDISDARLLLADSGTVQATGDGGGSAGRSSYEDDGDPVRQINHTTQHYQAEDSGPAGGGGSEPEPNLLQQANSSVSVDDRDSFFFQTFNSDDVTIIDDSFNTIDNSTTDVAITDIDATNSFNEGSFTTDDDVIAIDADNSFNSSDDDVVTAIQDNDTVNQDTDVLVAENSFNETADPASLAAVSPPSQLPAEPAADEAVVAADPVEDVPAEDVPFDEPPIDEAPIDEAPIDEPESEEPIDDDSADPATGDATDVVPV